MSTLYQELSNENLISAYKKKVMDFVAEENQIKKNSLNDEIGEMVSEIVSRNLTNEI